MFSQQKERAVKKALMLDQWISSRETKEIEEGYEVFSGAIKRVGDDFSWLAETLASLLIRSQRSGCVSVFLPRIASRSA